MSTVVDGRAVRGFVAKDAVSGAEDFEAARREAAAGSFVEAIWGEGPPSAKKAPRKKSSPKRRREFAGESSRDLLAARPFGANPQPGVVAGQSRAARFLGKLVRPVPPEHAAHRSLHREYGRKGLVVLGVNTEPAAKANDYLQANGITFPTLIDNGGAVGQQFQVRGISTVLIDRSGRVSAYLVGAGSEGRLRAAVEKAGL